MKIEGQPKHAVNILLFIDALDEQNESYHCNHFRLVQILPKKKLVQASGGKIVKVTLCLTRRPENVVVDVFRGCPGFRIHKNTHPDILTYVKELNGQVHQ
jgi:hypothetical protein